MVGTKSSLHSSRLPHLCDLPWCLNCHVSIRGGKIKGNRVKCNLNADEEFYMDVFISYLRPCSLFFKLASFHIDNFLFCKHRKTYLRSITLWWFLELSLVKCRYLMLLQTTVGKKNYQNYLDGKSLPGIWSVSSFRGWTPSWSHYIFSLIRGSQMAFCGNSLFDLTQKILAIWNVLS